MIHYLTELGPTGATIEREINEVYGKVISRQMINRWCTMFFDSRADVNNNVCTGWLSVIGNNRINTVSWLLEQVVWVRVSKTEKYFQ